MRQPNSQIASHHWVLISPTVVVSDILRTLRSRSAHYVAISILGHTDVHSESLISPISTYGHQFLAIIDNSQRTAYPLTNAARSALIPQAVKQQSDHIPLVSPSEVA